jgi:hypothetical protein
MERLAEELSEIDPILEDALSGLNDVLRRSGDEVPEEDGLAGLEVADDNSMDIDDDVLAQMEARLARLTSRVRLRPSARVFYFIDSQKPDMPNTSTGTKVRHEAADHTDRPSTTWTRLDSTRWKPCPIGSWGSSTSIAV